jgi:ABC-type Fe3+-hydroxamate transport system substrate-binding protein
MTIHRRLLSMIALLAVAAVLATSCAAPTATPTPTAAPTAAPTAEPTPAPFPATVKDADGKDFTLTAAPQKIVSLPVWSTEILFSLVDLSRVAAISSWINDPNQTPIAEAAQQIVQRVETKSPEGIIALHPDLVILDTFNDFDGSLAKTLTDAGIPTIRLESPTDFASVDAAIATLAAVTGETAKGEALSKEMNDKLQTVADLVKTVETAKRVTAMYYYVSFNDMTMLSSYNTETPVGAIMTAAGLVNVCDAPKYSDVSKEKVVKDWKPQAFLVSALVWKADYSGTTDDAGASAKAVVLADTTLKDVPAVVTGTFFAVPDKYMMSTSQYMADAVVFLAKAAYPDLFK